MSRIDRIFEQLRAEGRKALMPFVVAGDPALDALPGTLAALEQAGASIAEIGIPFSDPIADGPVIAEAMHRALQRGVSPSGVLAKVRDLRASVRMGLVAMVSVSIVERSGGAAFIAALADAGLDGVIVPDADLDAVDPLHAEAERRDLAFAMLVAPTSTDARIERLVKRCRGFVYLLARAGITGERQDAPEVESLVRRVRARTSLPLAVGFGIGTAAHVRAVCQHADAVIVGSSLVRRMAEGDPQTAADRAGAYVRELLKR
jgi:tryptophan synthase alpha chain